MHRRDEPASTDLGHQVSDIDDHAPRDVRGGDPDGGGIEHLEAAGGVLVQEGQKAGVGVRRAAEVWQRRSGRGSRERGVVQEAEGGEGGVQVGEEVGCRFAEGAGEEREEA